MTDIGDEHLYKLAAAAQGLDKRPLLDRLREAAKTSHYSLYAEAYCEIARLREEKAKIEETHERHHRIYVKFKIESEAEIRDLRATIEELTK